MSDNLKTPREWEPITGLEILDADGWRGRTGRSFQEPISVEEFRYRAALSTIRQKRAIWNETPNEEFERVMNEGPDDSDEEPDEG